jgi:hypothetical protein
MKRHRGQAVFSRDLLVDLADLDIQRQGQHYVGVWLK